MKPRIIMRIGAAYDEVVIDGHTFDRSGLNRNQRHAFAALVVEHLFPGRAKEAPRRPKGPRKGGRK
ncbi:hypothetical protein [Bosea sp. MMO-172]|uniref:hypothetical protein n=1 Tax=Bosea sp. MMO-172 TaxID=3127885 RepID=UPI00301A87B0